MKQNTHKEDHPVNLALLEGSIKVDSDPGFAILVEELERNKFILQCITIQTCYYKYNHSYLKRSKPAREGGRLHGGAHSDLVGEVVVAHLVVVEDREVGDQRLRTHHELAEDAVEGGDCRGQRGVEQKLEKQLEIHIWK